MGTTTWTPRRDTVRDSGLLYYAVGPEGAQNGHRMRSHEFQLQEGDCGDYHSLDGVLVDAHVGDARILKRGNVEKPSGENWRQTEGGKVVPLARGKFSLQSEGSEAYFRNIQVKPLAGPASPETF